MVHIDDLERRIPRTESVLIALSIAAIAAADHFQAPDASLGFLYLIPMSYSALAHRWPVFLSLLTLCVVLRQLDFPVGRSDWVHLLVDWSLVAAFAALVVPLRRLGRRRAEFFRRAREQRDALVSEVEMAAAVQQHLLDLHRPPGGPLDVVASTRAARVVGGDYYDFIPLGTDRLAVVVADVAGKGLPAALLMPAVKIALRAIAERRQSVPELLAALNRVFLDNLPPASYFTLFYGVFDPAQRSFEYACAGHPPALHVASDGSLARLDIGGPAVGLIADPVEYHSGTVRIEAGDLLIFYTDGITDAEDESGRDFGVERLEALAVSRRGATAQAVVDALHDAVDSFRACGPRGDDATVIAVRVPGA